jgi:hypothetical protein
MRRKECPGAGAGARRNRDAETFARNSQTAPPTQAPSVYVLRLESPRGEDIRRLRLLLKLLLRRYELRCLSVEQEPQR